MSFQRTDFISPLDHLSAVWENTPINWGSLESLERIELVDDQFKRDLVVNLNLPLLQELCTIFQDSLDFQIKLGENPVFILDSNVTEQHLINLQQDTVGSPSVRLYFRINKTRLAELYFGNIINSIEGSNQHYLYLYMDRLIDYLQKCRLEDLENYIWKKNKDSIILILTPNSDTFLIGPRLAILGGQYITPEVTSEFQRWPKKDIDLANHAYRLCRENLKWQESWLNLITPWHLFVLDKANGSPKLMKAFQIHFGNAFLLYTADFSFNQSIEGKLVRISRYSAPDKIVEVIHQSGTTILDIFQEQVELLSILDWVYDLQWTTSDRMTLAQHNIVDQINLAEESNRFLAIFQKAGTIRKNINWHWETFTQKNINIYMGLVKDLENYLSDVTDGFTTNIAMIQKALTDTMLAAVAVWIGSFIASLFDKPFNAFIFQVGLIAYGLYVLCFPLLYNMIQQWKGFNSYQEQITARKKRFFECLPESKVEKIWEEWKIEATKSRFKSSFWWTVGIYSVVIIASLVTAIILPGWVIYSASQLVSPTATPIITIIMTPTP